MTRQQTLLGKMECLVIAILMNATLINYTLVTFTNGKEEGYISIIYIYVLVFSCFLIFLRGKVTIRHEWMLLFGGILLWFFCTQSTSRIDVITLTACVAMPLFISSYIFIDIERVLIYTITVSAVFIPANVMLLSRPENNTISVDMAYALLPSITATLLHFKYFRKNAKQQTKLTYFIGCYYIIQLVINARRGPILCLFVVAFLVWIIQFDDQMEVKRNRFRKGISIALCASIAFLVFLEPILEIVISVFSTFKINAFFVQKTLDLMAQGDLSNGRGDLTQLALKGFAEHPLTGNGFDSFLAVTENVYPHNFLLQLLFDGGIIAFVVITYILVIGILNVIKKRNKADVILLLFLIPNAIIFPLLSQDMYNVPYLWFLIGVLLPKIRSRYLAENSFTSEGNFK